MSQIIFSLKFMKIGKLFGGGKREEGVVAPDTETPDPEVGSLSLHDLNVRYIEANVNPTEIPAGVVAKIKSAAQGRSDYGSDAPRVWQNLKDKISSYYSSEQEKLGSEMQAACGVDHMDPITFRIREFVIDNSNQLLTEKSVTQYFNQCNISLEQARSISNAYGTFLKRLLELGRKPNMAEVVDRLNDPAYFEEGAKNIQRLDALGSVLRKLTAKNIKEKTDVKIEELRKYFKK